MEKDTLFLFVKDSLSGMAQVDHQHHIMALAARPAASSSSRMVDSSDWKLTSAYSTTSDTSLGMDRRSRTVCLPA